MSASTDATRDDSTAGADLDLGEDLSPGPELDGGPDGSPEPLPRSRYEAQETLDAASIQSLTRCALRLDERGHPHAAYLVRDAQTRSDLLRYQRWDGERWLGTTLSGPWSLHANPSLTLDERGQPHLCVTDTVEEQLYYVRRVEDQLLAEPVAPVGDLAAECSITTTPEVILIAYTALGPDSTRRALNLASKPRQAQDARWTSAPLDADQHDVASAPTLWSADARRITLWYHAAQAGRASWRRGAWLADEPPAARHFTTKRPSLGEALPFIQLPTRAHARAHVLLHAEERPQGSSQQTLLHLEEDQPGLIIEGIVSPLANAIDLDAQGQPVILFNGPEGLYLAEPHASGWSLWTLPQAKHNIYSDCAALAIDDQGRRHVLHQLDTAQGPGSMRYHRLSAP